MALADIYQKATLVQIPSGYKAADAELYSVVPNTTAGDFTVSVDADATRVNKDGLVESVAANQARLDYDPTNPQDPHLLLEPSRTNTHTYSESASGKSTNNVTLTNNQAISPMGTNTAIKVTEDTTLNRHRFYADNNTVTSGTTYTVSFFVKKNSDNRYVFINAGALLGVSGSFDLDTGNVTGNMQVFDVYPNGWYRIGVTKTATSSTTNIYFVQMQQGTTDASYTGDGSSFYFWGQQFEVGNYPSSYIPVPSTGNVTRTADTCKLENFADIPTSYPFTAFVDMDVIEDETGYGFSILDISSDSLYWSVGYSEDSGNLGKFRFTNRAQGTAYNFNTISTYGTGRYKVAIKFISATNFKAFIDGVEVADYTHTSSAFNTNIDDILLGQLRVSGDVNTRNTVYQFMLFNEALSDSELQTLTS